MATSELWVRFKEHHDRSAKDALILHYVELVKIVAGRLYVNYHAHVEYEDLVSYGILGLIDAIEKFDLDKNVKFETYANFRIRGAVIDQLRSLDWIPRSMRHKYRQMEEVMERLQAAHGSAVDDALVAQEMGISREELSKLLSEFTVFTMVSLEEKIEENSNFSVKSHHPDANPEASYMERETKTLLKDQVDALPEKERMIVDLYYYSELTYKEIAAVMGISESRISQLHTKAMMRLKSALSAANN